MTATPLLTNLHSEMGYDWSMSANYDPGLFKCCLGADYVPMGVYGSSTRKPPFFFLLLCNCVDG